MENGVIILKVGSDKWLDQHERIEQLNKNAHQQAKGR